MFWRLCVYFFWRDIFNDFASIARYIFCDILWSFRFCGRSANYVKHVLFHWFYNRFVGFNILDFQVILSLARQSRVSATALGSHAEVKRSYDSKELGFFKQIRYTETKRPKKWTSDRKRSKVGWRVSKRNQKGAKGEPNGDQNAFKSSPPGRAQPARGACWAWKCLRVSFPHAPFPRSRSGFCSILFFL